jgi:hypothetical protein
VEFQSKPNLQAWASGWGPPLARKTDSHLLQSQPEGGYMDILAQLKAARDKAAFELGRLEAAVSALSGFGSKPTKTGKRRTMSAAVRRKISLAQRARWAKQNNTPVLVRPKRHVSAASRRRMAAGQKARWAKRNSNRLSIAKPRRTISAAARRRIAAAQRARWAKAKQEKKAA